MMQRLISFWQKTRAQIMQAKTGRPGIVRLTMTSRSNCEWNMERIVDAPWLPPLELLVREVEALDSHSDERRIEIPGATAFQGLVIRGACPPPSFRCAYVVLWPKQAAEEPPQATRAEPIADYDMVGRLLLLLMRVGGSGVAAAQSLGQTSVARRAGDALARKDDPELQAAAREYASRIGNHFDAMLIKACAKCNSE